MIEILLGFLSIFLIGCLSLIGIIMISIKEKVLDNILFILVAFGTGAILATALFSLIPEALHHLEELNEKGNRKIANLLDLFSMMGGTDISYKTVERLYSDDKIILGLHNLFVLILNKRGIKPM